jgi:hypothetical protein
MVAAGRDRQMAEGWATRNIGTIQKIYKIWEEQLRNIKGVFGTGKNRRWVDLRKSLIRALGKERVMTDETWG